MDIRVQTVNIKNFRSIRDLNITFSPEITLLVGPNGGGKSNILRALAILLNKYPLNEFDKNPFFGAPPTIDAPSINNVPKINRSTQCFHMEPLRQYLKFSPIIMDLLQLKSDGSNLAGAFNYYISSIPNPSNLELLLRKIKRIVPEVELVSAPYIGNGNAELSIQIKKDEKTLLVKADNATSGTLDAIFLVFILQILPEGSVYLLDSPDSHLHPGSQVAMMELLREVAKNEKKQFIIATHSPTLVEMCSPEEVILVTKKGLETTAHRVSDLSEILNILQNTDTTLSDIISATQPS